MTASDLFRLPAKLQEELEKLDASTAPLDQHKIAEALMAPGDAPISDDERKIARIDFLAFEFMAQNGKASDWGTHFGPMMTGVRDDGQPWQFPSHAELSSAAIQQWTHRASVLSHPFLRARYSDLAWDLARLVGEKPAAENARLASDEYLKIAVGFYDDLGDAQTAAVRSLDLAVQLKDQDRASKARAQLIILHKMAAAELQGWWWIAPQRLLRDGRSKLTAEELSALIASLEALVKTFGNASDGSKFDPHQLKDAAEYLIRHYRRARSRADIKRLEEAVARGFEAAADLADGLVAPSFLQESANFFREAGLKEESDRVRVRMQDALSRSKESLTAVSAEMEVSLDDMEKFLAAVVVEDIGLTLGLIARNFLVSKSAIEKQLADLAERATLQALISQQIIQDNHVAAVIGSVKDDLFGRVVHQATMHFAFSDVFLSEALGRAIEKHDLSAAHLAGWANRLNLFDDMTFLQDGLEAWFDGDNSKAFHMLIPQVEHAMRSIAAGLGVPVTKPHPATKDASVPINMGDMLSNTAVLDALGPNLSLHFRALYSDPRGNNFRNRVTHGTFRPSDLTPDKLRLVIHSLLMFGVWKSLAKIGRSATE